MCTDDPGDSVLGYNCTSGWEKCADCKQCIFSDFRCDGSPNCADGSDEGENCRNYTCPAHQWKCNDGLQCIDSDYLCDGFSHCLDHSDELDHEYCKRTCSGSFRWCRELLRCVFSESSTGALRTSRKFAV